MPQIEIPFTPGQRVRTVENTEFVVGDFEMRDGLWLFCELAGRWWAPSALTLVEPVIEWERRDEWSDWLSDDWYAKDDGWLLYGSIAPHVVGNFDNPRAIAEATQKMWNEARKG